MDPDQTFAALWRAVKDEDYQTAHDLASDMLRWLEAGGRPPTGRTAWNVKRYCKEVVKKSRPINPEGADGQGTD